MQAAPVVAHDSTPGSGVSLLFAHGCGFCKEVWSATIRRLQDAPQFQNVPVDVMSFDLPYHGSKRDVSEPATLQLDDPKSLIISHPAENVAKTSVTEVLHQVRLLRERNPRAPIFGIGHSLGAAAMWAAEAEHPGTFDGLTLFEPACNFRDFPHCEMIAPLLVSVTLPRPYSWNSMDEAQAYFRSAKSHARWHPEVLEAFILGAVVKNDPANNCFDTESAYTLACHPHIEAAHYTGPSIELSMDETGRVGCQVVFEYGARSQMSALEAKERLVQAYPDLYRLAAPIPKTSHMMIMEDPDTATARILGQFPAFHTASESLFAKM